MRGEGGRAKDDIRITCAGEVKKWTFHDDVIFGPPYGINRTRLEGLTRKIVPTGRGVCMRLVRIVINYYNFYPKI